MELKQGINPPSTFSLNNQSSISTSISIVNLVCYSQDLLTHGM